MKHFLLFILFILLIKHTAIAQVEHWDTYMASYSGKPGSMLVDMGLMATAPDKKYPYLVITGPHAQRCNKNGLPPKDEIDVLEDILSATTNFITGVTAYALAGTYTYNCDRLNYYYVKDTMGIRNAIVRMYTRGYKDYRFSVQIRPDPDWVTYRTFLYPNDETLHWMENDRILADMLQQGDSLTEQRNINFQFCFSSDTGRVGFAAFANAKGYTTDTLAMHNNKSQLYGLIAHKYGYVKMNAIDSMANDFKAELKKYHGAYYGWDAPLKPEHKK